MIRAIVADDEPPVRERVRALLSKAADIVLVAECADGLEAVRAIEQHAPDVVFLDVQMPGLDGLEVVDAIIGQDRTPVIVFVTAFDQYAVHAFDLEAVDYVLKPIEPQRFERALERVRSALDAGKVALPPVDSIAQHLPDAQRYLTRLVVRVSDRVTFIPMGEVEWLEAADNYVRVYTKAGSHLIRAQLSSLSARLDPKVFPRVHRSAVININAIAALSPKSHGEFVVKLRSGADVAVSRTYAADLRATLKGSSL